MENILVTKNFVRAAVLCVYMERGRFAMSSRGEREHRGNLLYLSFHRCKRTTFFGRSARDLLNSALEIKKCLYNFFSFTSNLGQIKSNDRNLFVLCKIVIENFYQPCAIMEKKKKMAQQFVPFSKLVECSLIKKASRRLSASVIHLQHLQHLQFQSTIQLGSNAETLERENLKNYLDPRQARHSKD